MKGRQDIHKHQLNLYQPVHSIENPVSYWPDNDTRENTSAVSKGSSQNDSLLTVYTFSDFLDKSLIYTHSNLHLTLSKDTTSMTLFKMATECIACLIFKGKYKNS